MQSSQSVKVSGLRQVMTGLTRGKRPMKSVLDDRAVEGMRWCGDVVVCRRNDDQAAVEAKAFTQPAGVSSSTREAGWVATRSRTSLKYRNGSTPASLQPWASV